MSVRVVARIRPLLKTEIERDQVVSVHDGADDRPSVVKIPNPKNLAEEYSFQFNSVYGQESTQQEIFETEVTPTVKHLFQGFDVTIFAYGSTGTGKTHTMRGGKSLVDRGMIPRLLSSIYRKSRAMEKSTNGETSVEVSMSYYEIYNDRVFDLFEAPEKRTATGLPIREAEGGKTVVVGLTEMPCSTLKDFEVLYDKANANRSTGATKLNAHSSRSHAVLCVKLAIITATETRVSTACAIDLAGSEDNRRTGNGKDRMVESASINKSLFVLAQCVEAISKKQQRIPYRESKMTRILSLGQNNGFTVMILNLAPTKAYHLDTLSSLNFANRTKKIEVREVENEPIFKGPPRQPAGLSLTGPNIQRQPLRPLTNVINVNLVAQREVTKNEKPAKLFAVYSDRSKVTVSTLNPSTHAIQKSSPAKRPAEGPLSSRPNKISRPTPSFIRRAPETTTITKASIESLVEKKVSEILAARTLNAPDPVPSKDVSVEVQKRLDSIEKRLEGQDGERAEGLSYLFMAKQHQARGEDGSALKMYQLAQPFFPQNEKLEKKIEKLKGKLQSRSEVVPRRETAPEPQTASHDRKYDDNDASYHEYDQYQASDGDDGYSDDEAQRHKHRKRPTATTRKAHLNISVTHDSPPTPRTAHLLSILNSRDISRIKSLHGLGVKRAEGIVEYLAELDGKKMKSRELQSGDNECYGSGSVSSEQFELRSWNDLNAIRGLGKKTLEGIKEGLVVSAY